MFQILKYPKKNYINTYLWFFSPIFILLTIFTIKKIDLVFFINFFQGENGLIENGTFVILFVAIIVSFSALKKIKSNLKKKKLFYFLIIFILGLIYFAGEEISWGQHWFHWQANEFFENYNDQSIGNTSETNFHNISSWFDQKPRIVLTFFVIVGGIICPLFLYRGLKSYDFKYWIYPDSNCFPTSLICLFFYLLDNSYKLLCSGTPGVDIKCKYIPSLLHFRTSEIIELYISLFLLIYISSINHKLDKN